MALKRFSGNPTYTRSTVDSADIIPFTHSPTADDNEDGKITFDELKGYCTDDINAKIPSAASESNQLADKSYTDTTYQKKLTAGSNVTISDENEISATDTTYTAGSNIVISETNEISCDVSTMNFKGSKDTAADLPTTADIGDVWNVLATNQNFCWNGTEWITIGSSVDISEIEEDITAIKKVIPSAATESNQLVDNAALNDTLTEYAKKDLSNASVPYVTEIGSDTSDEDDVKYWKKWSNGLIEQWGIKKITASGNIAITLPISYSEANYYISSAPYLKTSNTYTYRIRNIISSVNLFYVATYQDSGSGTAYAPYVTWETKGY